MNDVIDKKNLALQEKYTMVRYNGCFFVVHRS